MFYFVFEGNFPSTSPWGLYLEGRVNGGFFALPVLGAHTWRAYFRNFTVFILFRHKKRLFLPPRTMNCAKTVTTAREDVTSGLMYGRAAAITPFHVQISRSHLTLHYFCLICLIFNSKHDVVVACSRGSDSIDCFHLTSRRPYLCTKQWIGGHVCVQKKSCGKWTFFTC